MSPESEGTHSAYRRVGTVGKPHGVRGEFAVFLESDLPRWVASRKRFLVSNGEIYLPWLVESARFHHRTLLLKVDVLSSREEVEAARGQSLFVEEEEAREALLDPDFFYNSDLIGMCVIDSDNGVTYGDVCDVIDMPAQNLLEVTTPQNRRFHIPFTRELITHVDSDQGTISVRLPDGLIDL